MAECNSVLKPLKDGKLSEKPCADGKRTCWQDFFQATHSPVIIVLVHILYVIVLGYVTF